MTLAFFSLAEVEEVIRPYIPSSREPWRDTLVIIFRMDNDRS